MADYMTVYKDNHSVYQHPGFGLLSNAVPHRRLISKLNCGCHDLYVDTGCSGRSSARAAGRTQSCVRLRLSWGQTSLFDCLVYSHTSQQKSHLLY